MGPSEEHIMVPPQSMVGLMFGWPSSVPLSFCFPLRCIAVGRTVALSMQAAAARSQNEPRVLVLGAGRVSRTLVDLLGKSTDAVITVASEREEDARQVAAVVACRGRHVGLDVVNDVLGLSSLVQNSDLVISFLPAPMHPPVAVQCIEHKKDLVTASYESEEMRQMHERALAAGIIILNEVGLDPGLDHMSAMKIIDNVKERGGWVTGFTSVCGGLPAPAASGNPLRYKMSWSPRGVIRASQNGARYRWEDQVLEVPTGGLLQAAEPFVHAWPDLALECLPNRDSLQYERVYGIDRARTLFRGTLRYRGFSSLMNVFQNMGLFDESISTDARTWSELVNRLRVRRGDFDDADDFVLDCADQDHDEATRALAALKWLGILSDTPITKQSSSVVDAFCEVLEEKLQYEDGEHDMVVMHHMVEASFEDGNEESHHASLHVMGDSTSSAMSKTVGYTAAVAAGLILDGSLRGERGLLLPTSPKVYLPVLARMQREGIAFDEKIAVRQASYSGRKTEPSIQ